MDNEKTYHCLVVDDEPLAREVLCRFIERVPSLQLVAEASNAIEALHLLQRTQVDILFLDIQMPELTGIELIRTLNNAPRVVITTAYPQYAVEGYELDVADYLLKPVKFERFLKAVNKIFQRNPEMAAAVAPPSVKTNDYLYFRTDRKAVKVMLADIMYIEGMKNYIKVVTEKGTIITKNSIAAVEAMLPQEDFIRAHRSYIVPKLKVRSFTPDIIEIGPYEIPIGKLFKNNVLKALA